jgi:F0F1-type ATP synthase membrane subunit a
MRKIISYLARAVSLGLRLAANIKNEGRLLINVFKNQIPSGKALKL